MSFALWLMGDKAPKIEQEMTDSKRNERIQKIQKKAREISDPIIREAHANRLGKGESTVEKFGNSWAVKGYNFSKPKVDLNFD